MSNHTYKTGGDFMWEVGDLIWVEKTVTARVKSSTSDITKTQPRAKFMVYGEYKNPTYNVYYTGANTTNGLDVNIATQQTTRKAQRYQALRYKRRLRSGNSTQGGPTVRVRTRPQGKLPLLSAPDHKYHSCFQYIPHQDSCNLKQEQHRR